MSALRIDKEAPLPTSLNAEGSNFALPHGRHLLVATPRHIFAWDASGIHSIFQSSRNGIVAAKEAIDGSGILAVASRDVVVLHDTKRGKEHSWGLNAPEEEIRHLQYSHDAKSLYLSTTSDGLIQEYSLEKSRLLEPVQKHASAPAVVALSSTGHLMLSASSTPPAVYLKNLAHNTAASLIQPNVSSSPVCASAFHPERSDVFMLAFCDATVAAYDATRVTKAGHHTSQVASRSGEISHIKNLHRRTVAGDLSLDAPNTAPPVVGIAFLPGHKLRAVTAGRDGRCRIVDFANGGTVLRTWHCKAPCTSISVLTAGSSQRLGSSRSAPYATQRQYSSQLPAGGLIAVGLVDGRVQLYDTIGLLLAEERFSSIEEKITSVDWVNGPSPRAPGSDLESGHGKHEFRSLTKSGPDIPALPPAAPRSSNVDCKSKSTGKSRLGLPEGLKQTTAQSSQPWRQLVIHPDEVVASTVRRSSASRQSHTATLPNHQFEDLFSPVKITAPRTASQRQTSSPHMNRPRLSSQTFMRSPITVGKRYKQRLALSISSSASKSSSTTKGLSPRLLKSQKTTQPTRSQMSPSHSTNRHISFKPSAMNLGDATVGSSRRTASSHVNMTASKHLAKVIAARNTDLKKAIHPVLPEKRPDTTDEDVDIWLTSEDEGRLHQRPTRRRKKDNVPTCTLNTHRSRVPQAVHVADPLHLDISTEEEMLTARSIISSSNHLTSVSADIRELFPRSSSLSPRRGKREKTKQENKDLAPHARASPTGRDNKPPLTTLEVNAANGRQPRSPWARARARKEAPTTTKSVRKNEFVTVLRNTGDGSLEEYASPPAELKLSPRSMTCLTCPETKARVQALQGEVAQLKSEVLALKALLRRHGVDAKGLLR